MSLEQIRTIVALKRAADKHRAERSDAERRFRRALRMSGIDESSLSIASEILDTMDAYDIACAGRALDRRTELSIQRELRLSSNPMRDLSYPKTSQSWEAEDRLRSGHRALSDEAKTAEDTYHRYLSEQVVAYMKTENPSWMRGQVRVRLKVAPTGTLISRSIVVSSGDHRLDDAVLAAIERSHPYCPPPDIAVRFSGDIDVTISLVGVRPD
ncbi:TonB family protein [Hyphomicrobium sp. CS1BSMeth3]|uniref:TonB family protein n=1 Tax=Hyphomicrobium sp. CS1BSMeth3 TaxID=1892844 RepID=UPI0015760E45|nr:TonB family protein [Hyphomicrobium sp. CS1BSMeth3]